MEYNKTELKKYNYLISPKSFLRTPSIRNIVRVVNPFFTAGKHSCDIINEHKE